MGLIEPAIKAQAHADAAKTILKCALKWGSINQVATRAGISRRYLYKLRRGDAIPSPRTAEKISESIPLPVEQQRDLLEHWLLARESSETISNYARRNLDWLRQGAIAELTRAHLLATYSKTPREAKIYYKALLNLGSYLVEAFDAARLSMEAARAHTLLSDAFCVFNRPGAAFHQANMAKLVLDSIEDGNLSEERRLIFYNFRTKQEQVQEFQELLVNAIRIQAVAFNLLGYHKEAGQLCDRLLLDKAVMENPVVWQAHILREKLDTLSRDPTSSVTDLDRTSARGRTVCEENGDELGLFLILNFSARGYLVREKYKRAEDILDQGLAIIEKPDVLGQLHKALFFSTMATLNRAQGNKKEWKFYLAQALSIAREADLVEVAAGLHEEHGDHPAYRDLQEQIVFQR